VDDISRRDLGSAHGEVLVDASVPHCDGEVAILSDGDAGPVY